jgi:hypothetical protein
MTVSLRLFRFDHDVEVPEARSRTKPCLSTRSRGPGRPDRRPLKRGVLRHTGNPVAGPGTSARELMAPDGVLEHERR